jgi:uncharacterized protein
MKNYHKNKIFKKIAFIGAINWGLIGIFNFNLVEYLNNKFIKDPKFSKIVYSIIGLCGLILFLKKTKPHFLGPAVLPCYQLKNNHPIDFNKIVNIQIKPNTKIIYWASDEHHDKNKIHNDTWTAYGDYSNSGVTVSDEKGNATLKLKKPSQYIVPRKGLLPIHLHYRTCNSNGMMSKIETINL